MHTRGSKGSRMSVSSSYLKDTAPPHVPRGRGLPGAVRDLCGGLTEAPQGCHVAAALGAAGAVGIGGSGPIGCRLSPSALCWGSGGGVVLSTGGEESMEMLGVRPRSGAPQPSRPGPDTNV